jgi:hypothetical protein
MDLLVEQDGHLERMSPDEILSKACVPEARRLGEARDLNKSAVIEAIEPIEGDEAMEKALPGKLTEPGKNKKRVLARGSVHTPPREYREGGATKRGDYADPANYKYPIDTEEHVRAAVSYFSKPKNAGVYSAAEQKAIWGRIKGAAKRFGIELSEESGPPSVEKSVSTAFEDLDDYIQKSGGTGALPTGEPGLGAGVEVQRPADGGELAGVGETRGGAVPATDYWSNIPAAKHQTLSADDAEPEEQMKPGMKPIEQGGQRMGGGLEAQKSMSAGYTAQEARYETARASAATAARLRKGDADVVVGVGLAAAASDQPGGDIERARVRTQGDDSVVQYSDAADIVADRLQKSNGFYSHGSPTLSPPRAVISQAKLCKSCGTHHAAMLSACPACGAGGTVISPVPGAFVGGDALVLEKSLAPPLLRPRQQEPDLYLPGGCAME